MQTSNPTDKAKDLNQDYETIMSSGSGTVRVEVEWESDGDYFKKLSIYDEETPIKTSGNSIITEDF